MNLMAILTTCLPIHLTLALAIILYGRLPHAVTLLFSVISKGVLSCEIVDGASSKKLWVTERCCA